MKKVVYLCVLFLFVGLDTFSQEINQLNNGVLVRKGKITIKDGKSESFRNLKLSNGIITFSNSKGKVIEQKTSDVFKITKTGNYAVLGALGGGASALLGSLQGLGESYSAGYGSNGNETSLIVGLTAGGAVLGGLIGLMFKKEKTVYKNNASLSFYPTINATQDSKFYPMLSLKINLK